MGPSPASVVALQASPASPLRRAEIAARLDARPRRAKPSRVRQRAHTLLRPPWIAHRTAVGRRARPASQPRRPDAPLTAHIATVLPLSRGPSRPGARGRSIALARVPPARRTGGAARHGPRDAASSVPRHPSGRALRRRLPVQQHIAHAVQLRAIVLQRRKYVELAYAPTSKGP